MTEPESTSAPNAKLLELLLQRMMARDHGGMIALFTDDAQFEDPHYPLVHMRGRPAIARGFEWGLKVIAKPGFDIQRVWLEAESGVMEVDTHHVLVGGMQVRFRQLLCFETRADKIYSIRSFVPYREPGIGGWIPRVTGLFWRLRGQH